MSLRKFLQRTQMLIERGLYAARSTSSHGGSSPALEMRRLEQRLLFSASALAPIAAEVAEAGASLMSALQTQTAGDSGLEPSSGLSDSQMLDLMAETLLPAQSQSPEAEVVADPAQHTLELVFLDSSISNLDEMMANLRLEGAKDPSRTLEFVVLDSTKDGIAQITSALLRYNSIDGMHIVSHGGTGQVQLGSTWLSINNLDTYRNAVSAWQYSMSDKADILFYGCNLAGSEDGQQLLQQMSLLTDSDVAASEDATGGAKRNADWDLEYQVGTITTNVIFTNEFRADADFILATYTVTNTNDSGAGSFRQAILDTNANAGADTINFSIAATGVNTINLSTILPTIIGQVTINATTELDFAGTPLIVVNGGGTIATGFNLGAGSSNSIIRGFVIQNFTGDGIQIFSSGNWIAGNYIGTTSTGNAAAANSVGINIWDAGSNLIGGTSALDRNVISGNSNIGININGTTSAVSNTISGNYVGIGADGTTDLGNRSIGIYASTATNSTIGGTTAGAGNIISGTGTTGGGAAGIYLASTASGWTIQGNTVGLNAAGAGIVANDGVGIALLSSGNTIGGTRATARNVISGNNTVGINLTGTSANNNSILGNYIGTSASGLVDLGNAEDGIQLDTGASNNTIGGLTTTSRNIISGNNNAGIAIDDAASSGNIVQGNYIGLGSDGSTSLANTHDGINVNLAPNTIIGSTNTIGRNVMAADGQPLLSELSQRTQSFAENSGTLSAEVASSFNDEIPPVIDSRDVVLIDTQLQDSSLLAGAANPGAMVFTYDGTSESATSILDRVAAWSQESQTDIRTLSILSHGVAGGFELGNQWITTSTLDATAADWKQVARHFVQDADIYILGCDVGAAGGGGQQLLNELAFTTSAEVYASDDVTGVGGDWILEMASAGNATLDAAGLDQVFDVTELQATNVSLAWYNASWQYRQAVTVSAALLDGSVDETNFTILVDFTQASLKSTANGGNVVQTDGGDILFTLSDGTTKLSHQIESYDAVTGRIKAWVKVPTLSALSNTSLYAYYGNAAAADQWNDSGTWNSSYGGVWHLSNNDLTDSTANNNDGSNVGSTNTTGIIEEGRAFNGSSQNITVADSNSLDEATLITISAWINPTVNDNSWRSIVGKGPDSAAGNYWFGIRQSQLEFWSGGTGYDSNVNISLNTWSHVASTFNASTNTLRIYVNGAEIYFNTSASANPGINSDSLYIGRSSLNNEWWQGSLDEVRFQNTEESANEIESQYRTQSSPGTYVTFSSEEGTPVITSNGGGATASISVAENSTAVTTVAATDPGTPLQTLTYSISGGVDAARFSINSSSGALTFVSAQNFEAPTDSGANNVYDLIVQVSDGTLTDTQAIAVTVTNVNDAPTATNLSAAETYTEDTALNLTDIVISDVDSATVTATLTLSNAAAGSLNTGTSGAVTSTYNAGTGVWSASGATADVNTLLAALTFTPASNFNSNFTIATSVSDGSLSVTGSKSMTGTAVNDAATISNLAGDRYDYTAGAGAVVIDQGDNASVSDLDSANFDSGNLTISIASGGSVSEDRLSVRNQGTGAGQIGVSGSNITFGGVVIGTLAGGTSGADLVVSLNSNATTAAVSALVRNITFQNTNVSSPVNGSREINFTLYDGDGGVSLGYDATVNIAGANTATILDRFSNTSYSNNDGTQNWSTSWTELGESNGPTSGFVEVDTSTNTLEIGSGSTLLLFSTNIDGLGSRRTADLSGAISATVSVDVWKAGVSSNGSLTLAVSTDGTTWTNINTFNFLSLSTSRATFTYDISAYTSATTSVRLLGAGSVGGFLASGYFYADNIGINYVHNTAPVFSLPGTQVNYTENDAATVIDATATVTDLESPNFNGGQLTIDFAAGGAAEDRLAIRNQGTGAGQVGVSGSNVTFGGVTIGTFTGGTSGASPLVVSFNTNATPTAVQAVARNITYFNTSDDPSTAIRQVRFGVTDGDGGSSSFVSENIVVSRLNDAPVLDTTGTMTLTTITEDDTANAGQTLASIVSSAGGDRISDVDTSAVEGIAITATTNGNGSWQYSTNGGTSWSSVGTVAGNSALLLRSTDMLRFIPNAQNATTGDITLRAWDQTSGTAGTKVDASTTGGSTSFSTSTETASITVTAVNDEQVLATNIGITVVENSTGNTITDSMLLTTDVDNTATELVYTVTSAASNGTLRLNGVALANGSTFTQADINSGLVTYDHNGTENFTDAFSFSVDDGTSTTSTGTFNLTITSVNDNDPTITSNGASSTASISIAENTTAVTTVTATDSDLPAQTLTYSITGGADSGLFTINGSSGVLSFTAGRNFEAMTDANADGIHIVNVQVSDGTRTDTQTISVTITDVNEFSVGTVTDSNAATNTVAENSAIGTTVGVTGLATDPDGTDVVTYSLTNDAGGRFAIDANTGVVTVAGAIDREAAASYSITMRATSTDTSFTTLTASIAITDMNEFSVSTSTDANATANSVAENAANGTLVGITASAVDSDATTNTVTYSLVDDAGGRFAINATTGVVTVADGTLLNFEAATSHNISIQAASSDLSTATQVLTIALTDVNETPVSVMDAATAVEAGGTSNGVPGTDPTGNVMTNDTDVDAGDTKAMSGVVAGTSASASGSVGANVAGAYGTINIAANGTFSYVVNNNNAAVQALRTSSDTLTDTFTYTMTDSGGLTSSTQVTITIQGANDAPVGINDSSTAVEAGGVANGTAGSDASGAVLTNDTDVDAGDTKAVSGLTAGVSASVSGSVGANLAGSYGTITLNSDGTYSYSIDNANAAVQALAVGGTLQDIFTYTVTDTDGLTSTAQITITVQGANDAPVVVANSLSLSEGQTVVLSSSDLLTADVDTAATGLIYTATNVTHGRFEFATAPGVAITSFTQAQVNAGQVRFVHDGSDTAPSYELTVSDGSLSDGPSTVTITSFGNLNDAPVATITAASYTVNEQTTLILHGTGLSISDIDAASSTVEATISVVSGVLTASAGTTGVTVTGSGTNSIAFSGTLAQINDLLAGNLGGTLSCMQNSDTPPATDTLTLLISDLGNTGSGGTLTQSVNRTINITAVNDAPTVVLPTAQTINVNTVMTLSGASAISITDVDATTVQITLTASNGGITLSRTTGLTFSTGNGSDDATMIFTGSIADVNAALNGLTFMHGINHGGAAMISVAVSDLGGTGIGGALTDADTISVTINTPGGAPINGDAFLQGSYLQVGFGADGSIGSDFGAPGGYVSGGSQLGVEVDLNGDGWGTYDGDFILPGSPEEGWGVTVNSTSYSNNNVIAQEIAGTLTNQQNTTSTQSVDWAGGVGGLSINTTYSIGVNDLFIDVQVTLTNTSGLSLNDLYYYRNIDADNNFYFTGNFATTNTIVSQGNDGSGVSLVTATQADGSYVGLMGFGSNSRVTYGGFANRDGAAIFNGAGLNQSGTSTADEAISLAFHVTSLTAGDSTILQYRYYFGHAGSAPVLDLDANNSSGLGGANFTTNFTEGSSPVTIVDSDAALADIDSNNLSGMTVSITNRQDGVAELLSANTSGTSITANYNASTGVLTLSGSDSVANYRQVLRTITYENTSQNPDTTVRQISITATDDTNTSNTAHSFVSVTAVNDTPVLATNTTSTVSEGGTDVITNSELQTTDVDNTAIQISYSVTSAPTNGYLELSTNPGVAITNFTQADLNTGLVRYVHDSSNTTTDSFTFTVTDGALTIGTYTHNYTITAVNDAPVVVTNALTISESGTVVLTNAELLATDSDNSAAQLTYTVSGVTGGRFEFVANTGVAISSFTQAQITSGLVQFVHDGNEAAPTYSVTVSDGVLSNGAYTASIGFTNINDVPVITDATLSLPENSVNGTSVGTVNLTDPDTVDSHAFSIIGGNTGNAFGINATTGDITVNDASMLDFETTPVFTLTVRVQDLAGTFDTATITLNLANIDEYDTTAIVDTNAAADSLAENAANGTVVGITAFADDLDQPDTIAYSLDDNSGGRFTINAMTGVVTVANSSLLNYENATSHNITVRATSTDASFSLQTCTIAVTDVNESVLSPIADTNAAANTVAENAANGAMVGYTAFAADADATTNAVNYSLVDNAGGRFAIDSVTGIVTVANGTLLNRETAAAHTIIVRADSSDGSFSTISVDISLIDVNEFAISPAADINATANVVAELSLQGTLTGITVRATDADATTNAITYSLDNGAGGRFQIDTNTGIVSVGATALDYETASSYAITARATSSDGSTTTITLTVNLTDVNEFGISSVDDTNAAVNEVLENAANGTLVGITAFASDADGTDLITYSLANSAGGRFTIDAATGIVTVADGTLLNREVAASYNIIVQAGSTDGSTSNQPYTISLLDVNEFNVSPITDTNAALDRINENSTNGTVVGIVANSFDSDATTNAITYTLDDNAGGRFAIDSVTGVVTVANGSRLDYETATSHNIIVRATSADSSTTTRTFTIDLIDLNDTPPVITPGQQFTVSELATVGTIVGNVIATDADGTGTLQNWTITSGNTDNIFSINAVTGRITVTDVTRLNFESRTSYSLTVTVGDSSNTSAAQTVTINIVDQNEAPVLNTIPTISINENSVNGTVIGTASSSDVDGGDVLRYSLQSGTGVPPFSIDTVTGAIRVADSAQLNFEQMRSFTFTIIVSDAAGMTDTQVVTVNLADINEAPTDVLLSGGLVQENWAAGTYVATITGLDADAGDTRSYSLLNNAGGRFIVDAATGIIRVASGAVLNFETAPAQTIIAQVTDSFGLSVQKSFVINLQDINEAPIAYAETVTTLQMTSLILTGGGVLSNDYDDDNDLLHAVLVTGPAHGTLILNDDGTMIYMPASVFTGTDVFTYRVSDGRLLSNEVTVTIDVLQTVSPNSGGSGGGSTGGGDPGSGTGSTNTGDNTNPNSGTGDNGSSGIPSTTPGNSNNTGTNTSDDPDTSDSDNSNTDTGPGDATQDVGNIPAEPNSLVDVQLSVILAQGDITVKIPGAALKSASANAETGNQNRDGLGTSSSFGTFKSVWGTMIDAYGVYDAVVKTDYLSINRDVTESADNETLSPDLVDSVVVGSTAVVTTSLSVGYVIWILRGGSLLTAFMSALPAWQAFDPLPILQTFEKRNEEDDDSLLSIATRKFIKRSPKK